ncbi:MAG: hypothetical protein R3D55_11775 [Chloroflexota bacterium]
MRNLTKSAEEKRQETIAAYVDGVLNGRSRQQFEQEMAQDNTLRQEVEQLLLIKQSLRQLPLREVPRNFILDPAEFSRPPARQPWVQAYPVLRTATALAAFFFVFAVAAGAFTGFGMQAAPAMAPAADVAQVEQIETTRVVTETTETLAFEAEPAAEAEITAEEVGEEEMAADMAEEAEVAMEDAATADEAAAAEAAPEEPAAAPQSDAAEEGAAGAQATAVPASSPTPEPSPTVSTSPRVTSPTPLPDRDLEQAEAADEVANDAVVNIPTPAVEDETEAAEITAVLPEEEAEAITPEQPANPLLWLQLGLGGLLILLLVLTFYARRQR